MPFLLSFQIDGTLLLLFLLGLLRGFRLAPAFHLRHASVALVFFFLSFSELPVRFRTSDRDGVQDPSVNKRLAVIVGVERKFPRFLECREFVVQNPEDVGVLEALKHHFALLKYFTKNLSLVGKIQRFKLYILPDLIVVSFQDPINLD